MTTSRYLLSRTDPQGPPRRERVLLDTRPAGVARTNHLPVRRDLRAQQQPRKGNPS
jgi:hypothetical protein